MYSILHQVILENEITHTKETILVYPGFSKS